MNLKEFAKLAAAVMSGARLSELRKWVNRWKPGMVKYKSHDMRPFFKEELGLSSHPVPTSSKLWDRGMPAHGGKRFGGARRAGTR